MLMTVTMVMIWVLLHAWGVGGRTAHALIDSEFVRVIQRMASKTLRLSWLAWYACVLPYHHRCIRPFCCRSDTLGTHRPPRKKVPTSGRKRENSDIQLIKYSWLELGVDWT